MIVWLLIFLGAFLVTSPGFVALAVQSPSRPVWRMPAMHLPQIRLEVSW